MPTKAIPNAYRTATHTSSSTARLKRGSSLRNQLPPAAGSIRLEGEFLIRIPAPKPTGGRPPYWMHARSTPLAVLKGAGLGLKSARVKLFLVRDCRGSVTVITHSLMV